MYGEQRDEGGRHDRGDRPVRGGAQPERERVAGSADEQGEPDVVEQDVAGEVDGTDQGGREQYERGKHEQGQGDRGERDSCAAGRAAAFSRPYRPCAEGACG